MQRNPPETTLPAGGALLCCLASAGIENVFVNSGTDFPPIIEGLLAARELGLSLPNLVTVPHEHAAMGMAHGHYLISGRPQAVMLHTNVGLANGAIGAINAACEQVPILIMSGRTPTTEEGRFGARTVPIGWGQEMRDQGALVREACKWEYELRFPEQVPGLVARMLAIAGSTPMGPVYLSLPREVLCEPVDLADLPEDGQDLIRPSIGAPNPADIELLASWIAKAKSPLIVAQRGAGNEESFQTFAGMVDDWSIPVCTWWATALAISTDHPCHVGSEPGPWLESADLIVVLNALAPWWPDNHRPRSDAKIVNLGPDPVFSRFPIRNFRSDLSISGELPQIIETLADVLGQCPPGHESAVARRISVLEASECVRQGRQAERSSGRGIAREQMSQCLGHVLEELDSSLFSELGVTLDLLTRRGRSSWFQEPHSGGLGWSFPAAIGAKLADPARVCVAAMGDGSYMFANPVACHHVSEALGLPVLIVVLNNGEWGAVRKSVTGLYPDGLAARVNSMPLTSLSPSPDFTLVAKSCRAWAKQVADADELESSLRDALAVVAGKGRTALVEVLTQPD